MDGTTTLNDFDFPVELVPLSCLTKDGHNINVPENMSRALIRPDTHDVLGVHGSKYRITTHSQVVDTVEEAVVKANLSDLTMNVDVYENGALLKGTISFNDITIEPVVGDYIRFDINFWNSYNGQWSIQISGDGRRLFLYERLHHAPPVARTFRKHSSNINTEEQEANKLARSLDIFFNQKDIWKAWSNCNVFRDDVENLFREELCRYPSKSSWERFNMKQLDELMRQYDVERQTLGNTAWAGTTP